MEATGNSVADFDPRHPLANGGDLTRAVGKRHDGELCRTSTATLEDHQIPIVERARAHSHQDLLRTGPGVLTRSQHDPVNAAEAVDAVGFHLFPPPDSPR